MGGAIAFLQTPLGTTIGINIVVFVTFWIFRESFIGWVKQKVGRDIEGYKHELELKKEFLRNELESDMLKNKYLTQSVQEIYPEVYKKLLYSEGMLGVFFGLRMLPNWQALNAIEVEKILKSKEIDKVEIQRIVGLYNSNDPSRAKEAQSTLDLKELYRVEWEIRQLKNYFLEKCLFVSNEIKDLYHEANVLLWDVWCDLESHFLHFRNMKGSPFQKASKNHKDIILKIDEIEIQMRKELFPAQSLK